MYCDITWFSLENGSGDEAFTGIPPREICIEENFISHLEIIVKMLDKFFQSSRHETFHFNPNSFTCWSNKLDFLNLYCI